MKKKLLTLFTLVALLTAFSIPLMQCTTSISATQNTVLSPIAKTVPEGGSIEWQVQLNNAVGQSIAVTSNESYIYVGGANWTDPTNSSTWQPTLWKYNNSGSPVWNTTLNSQGYFLEGFISVDLSPDNSSVYTAGNLFNGSAYSPTLVKFNAANGNYIWNYTISSGGVYNQIYSVKVSPDSETVYLAAMLSKSSNIWYNSSFYVAAIKSSDGTLDWQYDLYLNGSYDYGSARDLALSPSGGVLYASGYYTVLLNWTNAINLVTIDTSSHSQLWNRTTSSGYGFGINFFDISSDGNKIYAIEYPGNLVTIDTSNGSTIENVSISNPIATQGLSLSFNESKLYVLTNVLQAYGQNLPTYMVELNFSGTVTGVITSPNSLIRPYGLAPANDNESVYIVGSSEDYLNNKYSMLLLKGKAGPIPPPPILPLLLYAMLSQNQGLSLQMNFSLVGVGIAAVLVVASFLIARTLRGKRVENV